MPTFTLTTNVDQILKRLERRTKQMESSFRKATTEATKEVYAESRAQMTELIYDKPIPTRNELQQERMGKEQRRGRITGLAAKGVRPGRKTGGGTAYKNYGKSGNKPAWKRTGNLRREEKMTVVSAYEGVIHNEAHSQSSKGKTSAYAAARHNAGLPGHKQTRYPAQWRTKAVQKKQGKVKEIYRKAVLNSIGGKG